MISTAFGLIAVLGWSSTVTRLSRGARIPDVSSNVWLPNAELLLDVAGLGGYITLDTIFPARGRCYHWYYGEFPRISSPACAAWL